MVSEMAERSDDIGALLSRVLDIVVEREEPILRAHGVSMWEYVILSRLEGQDGITQKDLARESRRDPTRLGANLDALGERGLISRSVDPGDRRRMVVRITGDGAALTGRVRAEIAAMESEVLGGTAEKLRSALTAALDGSSASAR
jgi:DNA-binding MarR family transcriptional regulator